MEKLKQFRFGFFLAIATIVLLSPPMVKTGFTAPGDVLANVTLPKDTGRGFGLASNCERREGVTIFYTNQFDLPFIGCQIHKTDAEGNDLGSILLKDSVTGNLIGPDAACPNALQWDETRKVLWAGIKRCTRIGGVFSMPIYTVDPETGITTFKFIIPFEDGIDADLETILVNSCFTDGISYDASTDTVYFSDDLMPNIGEFRAEPPHDLVRIITPNIDGVPLWDIDPKNDTCVQVFGDRCGISGILVDKRGRIFAGRGPLQKINIIDKITGESFDEFPSPQGRDEDMECDPITFAPKEAIWVRGAFDGTATAFEVEPGTCLCGGVDINPTREVPTMSEWGLVATAVILFGVGVIFMRRRRAV